MAALKELLDQDTAEIIALYNQDTGETYEIKAVGHTDNEDGKPDSIFIAFSPSNETHCPCCKEREE